MSDIDVNGRRYQHPTSPVVVVCIDGSAPEYHERAIAAGRMPFAESIVRTGSALSGDCAMPSFTNPNNVSIATGVPPSVHGITGNYFFDRDRGDEVMMNDAAFLRVPTIFAEFERAGAAVAVVTAKDKLRALLGAGLTMGACFSAEKADHAVVGKQAVLDLVDRPVPSVYSPDLSEFVMAAGVRLLETRRPMLMYLSLSDYVQHRFAPDEAEAIEFYAMLDGYLERLHALGAVLVLTADHGMTAKSAADGTPRVVYLGESLDGRARVVLPITDPYTLHHAALGSFAFVYLDGDVDVSSVAHQLADLHGVDEVIPRDQACDRFELPADRVGDLAVVAGGGYVLGTTPDRHDLSRLDRPLRSHGGLAEQEVPLLVNRRIAPIPARHRLRNFDAFWLGLNFAKSE